MDLTGRRVGNYIVEGLIGRGAMGSVYVARHETLFRRVAIKVILPELAANPGLIERFIDEARQVSRLGHPALVQVLDFGVLEDGQRYSVMEYLEGSDLETVLRTGGPLAPERVVRLCAEIADGLAVVHDAGIVHRDLKPENLFLVRSPGGESVRILDFGIAKLMSTDPGATGRTQVGAILGTPRYLAPEQARSARTIDARCDQYSLGVVLYELLSGTPPFISANPIELLTLHAGAPPQPLVERAPHVPPALAAVVMRCLEKEPANRFPDMRALRDALRASLGGTAALGARPGGGRKRYVALAVGAMVVAVGTIALITMRDPTPEASATAPPPPPAKDPAPPPPRPVAAVPDAAPPKAAVILPNPSPNPIPPDDSAAIGAGAAIFSSSCARCHGARGEGDGQETPPGLEPKSFADLGALPGALDAYRFEIIRRGVEQAGKQTMPSFADKLTEEDTWKVVTFLGTLAPAIPRDARPSERPALTPALAARGAKLFARKCASCHGKKGKGDGPAQEFIATLPADLTAGVFKLRSTPKGSLPTDEDLFRTLTRGMGVGGMPSFAKLTEEERWSLVAHVKTLSPRFRREKPDPPITIPARPADTAAAVGRGNAAYLAAGCPKCHGYTGRGDGVRASLLRDRRDRAVRPTDFRTPQLFIGGAEPEDIYRSLMTGIDGTPMPQGDEFLKDSDALDVVEFIVSLRAGG
jgi:serine/threonine-protein kinase